MLLCGDFNVTTGNEDIRLSTSVTIPERREFEDILRSDEIPPRAVKDTMNKQGRELLNFCEVYSCHIAIGRLDTCIGVGEFTFINQNGSSIEYTDYFILTKPVYIYDVAVDFKIIFIYIRV